MKDDTLFLIHISECLERILSYTKEGKEVFMNSSVLQDAVIRNFEIIGEAAKQISSALKEKYAVLRWRQIAGFRDVLIHNYFGVDLSEVWRVVENEVKPLQTKVREILAEL